MKKILLILIFFIYTNVYSNIIDIDYLKNTYSNDVEAYLYMKDVISTPVVKAKDNDYYLNHDIYGNDSITGSIFLDYRSNINKIIIYGHNSNIYAVPFKKLEQYLDSTFLNTHRYFDLLYNNYVYKYYINDIYVVNDSTTYEYVINNYDLVIQTCYKDGYILISSTRYDLY